MGHAPFVREMDTSSFPSCLGGKAITTSIAEAAHLYLTRFHDEGQYLTTTSRTFMSSYAIIQGACVSMQRQTCYQHTRNEHAYGASCRTTAWVTSSHARLHLW